MIRNAQQNKRLHLLIGELNIDKEAKQDMVYQFTNKRETSTAKMNVVECQNMINHLAQLKKQAVDKKDRMRKKILSICHEMQWTLNGQIDWKRLNEFLNKSGYLHKPLNDYTLAELPKLVTQFENLLKSYYAKL